MHSENFAGAGTGLPVGLRLGCPEFKTAYGLRYAYLAGGMYKGIASVELVVAMTRAGCLGYLGAGGMELERVQACICAIQEQLKPGQPFGVNLLSNLDRPALERATVDLLLKYKVRYVEAAAYLKVSKELVRYRLSGAHRDARGRAVIPNHIMAKVSRPELARSFMEPAPREMVQQLLREGALTRDEASMASEVPLAGEICVECDSGGHTDQGVAYTLLPTIIRLRMDAMQNHGYDRAISIGTAGGIGTPEAAAAAFILGADFIMTGSINQCSVESGISATVKQLLQGAEVQDTAYAPAGDLFEFGAKVQVLKRGMLFHVRANKLYDLYCRHSSIEDLDPQTRSLIESRYFGRTFGEVWQETKDYYVGKRQKTEEELEANPKQKMAMIFKWYFVHSTRLAFAGSGSVIDYQVHCGPAMGAFNRWVMGTRMESWTHRHVGEIAHLLMEEAAAILRSRLNRYAAYPSAQSGTLAAYGMGDPTLHMVRETKP